MYVVGILFLMAVFMYLVVCGAASLQDREADDREQAEYLRNLRSARQPGTQGDNKVSYS